MIDLIRPRWWVAAAVAAFALGVIGLYIDLPQWAPMALLAGELLAILAAITITTPSISESLAKQQAAQTSATEAAADQPEPEQPQAEVAPPEDEQAS
ncbi:MAG TPA: hypothetical protein VGD58_02685 [Herpetosiphonaceae bacterium]